MKKFALLLLSVQTAAVAETSVLPIPVSKQVFVDGKFDDRIVPAERLERADETEIPVLPLASYAPSFDEQIDNAFRLLQRAAPKRAAAPVVASVGKAEETEIKPVATHKKFSNEAAFGTGASMPSETLATGEAAEAVSDGNASLAGLEEQINRAVVARDWDTLQTLLESYRALPDFNPVLHDYALGGLRRSQLRHDEAVALYRSILAQQPDLAYPRFDLGVMLFENRQYREAKAELERAKPDLQPPMQQLADRYLAAIDKAQGWKPDVSLQYEQTDNVNNASSEKTIEFAGKSWTKTADSLPQKAHGLRYGLGVSREINAGGHHFLYGDISGGGVHYWDNKDFSEQSLRLSLGYKKPFSNALVRHRAVCRAKPLRWQPIQFRRRLQCRFLPTLERTLAVDAERGQYVEALSGRPHCRPIRQPYAAGGHDADVFRAERLAALRRCGLVARHDERGGTGFRPQGFACRRGQNVRRRPGSAGKPALYTQDV